jgi:hypothetical protein
MKVHAVKYGMLRVTAQYENDRFEVEMLVEEGDRLGDVVAEAKAICTAALSADRNVVRRQTFEEAFDAARRADRAAYPRR